MSIDSTSRHLFTSESVTSGHPDKIADQISDGVLDALLEVDRSSRVACETLVTTGLVVVAGEISTEAYIDIPRVVRDTIIGIGYDREDYGFDGSTCGVMLSIDDQSPDINQGLQRLDPMEQGAGDQGMMFGYACNETPEMMPLPIHLAHRLVERLADVRSACSVPYLRPDGKSQVTFEYHGTHPVALKTVLISAHHRDGIDLTEMTDDIKEQVIEPVVPEQFRGDGYEVLVNPTGRFVRGGPMADAGLTGRKIIVDTYGGMARHGGGAFSGKDPSKVDRSAAYAARWVAKNVVASGAASRCEVQVSYAIGLARPVSVMVETFGTETVDPFKINKQVNEIFDLRPAAIIAELDLLRPIYRKTAAYGHFGRSPESTFTWERTNRSNDLRLALGC